MVICLLEGGQHQWIPSKPDFHLLLVEEPFQCLLIQREGQFLGAAFPDRGFTLKIVISLSCFSIGKVPDLYNSTSW